MEEAQHVLQHRHEDDLCATARFAARRVEIGLALGIEPRLDELEIPIAKFPPGEVVKRRHVLIELIAFERGIDTLAQAAQKRKNPAVLEHQRAPVRPDRQRIGLQIFGVHQNEPGRVPELVGEVAITLETLHREIDLARLRRVRGQGQAHGIGALGGDDHERIDRVAFAFAHLAAVLVHDERRDENTAERDVLHDLESHHDHARDPEENDVVRRDEVRGGVIARQLRRLLRPAHRRERPQRRREPGIEHVGVLRDACAFAFGASLQYAFIDAGHVAAFLAREYRNAVAPPELARDAPVAHALQPGEVGLLRRARNELDPPVPHGLDRLFGQRAHLHEPLLGDERLDDAARAIAMADGVSMGLDFLDQPGRFHVLDDAPPRLGDLQPGVLPRVIVEPPIGKKNVDELQLVALTHRIVVGIVRRSYFDHPRAELGAHKRIGDNGNLAVHERQHAALPDQVRISLVLGIHRDGAVAEHRLGPRRGHNGMARAVLVRVAEIPERSLDVAVLDLVIAERGLELGAPVDQIIAAIDQPLVEEPLEDDPDGAREPLVHREALALPVARAAQALELPDNRRAVALFPFPDAPDEFVAPKVAVVDPFLSEFALDDVLGRDAGVVGAGQPERVAPLHASPTHQDVLDRSVERMTEMENARYVGRRDDDGVTFTAAGGLCMEVTRLLPLGVEALFNGFGIVLGSQVFHKPLSRRRGRRRFHPAPSGRLAPLRESQRARQPQSLPWRPERGKARGVRVAARRSGRRWIKDA